MRTDRVQQVARILVATLAITAACGERGRSAPPIDAAPTAKSPAVIPSRVSAASVAPPAAPLPGPEVDEYLECSVRSTNLVTVLDEAARRFDAGDFSVSLACSDVAADLAPQAVEAQHLRAAALSALGRHNEAQVAFALAMALDPDDPETLLAAADFYINVLSPKRRATVQVGLEYARRGSERAQSRRRTDRALRARLLLLEAEGLNDLGISELALERVDEALEWDSTLVEAIHERGVSLFSLCRLSEAEEAFLAVLGTAPNDPYAHYHLGLIYELLHRPDDATAHLTRARTVAPDEFPEPVMLDEAEFRSAVQEAVAALPSDSAELVELVELEVADLPSLHDLAAADPPFAPTILGLFRGLPLGVELPPAAGEVPGRSVVLYRKNLARAVRTREELQRQIQRTLQHEIGHLRGYDEDELRRRGLD